MTTKIGLWRFLSALMVLVMAFAALGVSPRTVLAAEEYLGGVATLGDLKVHVRDTPAGSSGLNTGIFTVYRYDGANWQRQIFGPYSKDQRLYVAGTGYRFGNYYGATSEPQFTAASNVKSGNTITTTWQQGNLQVMQYVTYDPGNAFYYLRWEITNNGSSALSDLRFFHGEDTYLAGGDMGKGFWVESTKSIGSQKLVGGVLQRMVLQGVTPPYAYESRGYNLVMQSVNANALTNAVDSNEVDNGYALEWRTDTLNPGQTWTIRAIEKFTSGDADTVLVLAPTLTECQPGTVCQMTFTVENVTGSAISVDLSAVNTAGWTMSIDPTSPVSIPANGTITVTVNVTIPAGTSPGTTTNVTLTATPSTGSPASDMGTINVTSGGGGGNPVSLDIPTVSVDYHGLSPAVVVAPDLVINGDAPATLEGARVLIGAGFDSNDRLEINGSTSGTIGAITYSYNASSGILSLDGVDTLANYQAALRLVTYRNLINPGSSSTRAVEFSLGTALAFSGNGHFYRYFPSSGIDWGDANAAANASTYFGLQGYLVTITSAEENDFAFSKIQNQGWIGASDDAVEGVWQWVTGPEAGTTFCIDSGAADPNPTPSPNCVPQGGAYVNWDTGEPNNFEIGGDGEDHGHFRTSGKWNDFRYDNNVIVGYVVEYGGMAGDPAISLTDTVTVNVFPANEPLSISKTAEDLNGAPLRPGDTVRYVITVQNTTSTSHTNVVVTDTLPAGVTFTSATPPAASGPNPLVWNVGTLAPAASWTGTILVTVDSGVSQIGGNVATVDSDQMDQIATDPIFPPGGGEVIPLTDLQATIVLQQNMLYDVTYVVTFTNAGPVSANGAPVVANFPPTMSVTWTCVAVGGASCPAASGSGDIHHTLASLPVNGTVTYTVQGALQNQLSQVDAQATIATPAGVDDSNLANNTAAIIRYRLVMPVLFKH